MYKSTKGHKPRLGSENVYKIYLHIFIKENGFLIRRWQKNINKNKTRETREKQKTWC